MACRCRDHDGNRDVLRKPDGVGFAWEMTEAQADALIAHVQSTHWKEHGQSYWLCYRKGALRTSLKTNKIRV